MCKALGALLLRSADFNEKYLLLCAQRLSSGSESMCQAPGARQLIAPGASLHRLLLVQTLPPQMGRRCEFHIISLYFVSSWGSTPAICCGNWLNSVGYLPSLISHPVPSWHSLPCPNKLFGLKSYSQNLLLREAKSRQTATKTKDSHEVFALTFFFAILMSIFFMNNKVNVFIVF